MTQPSVSTHVEALERELKGELFHRRRGRSNELTHLGTTFLKHARQVLADADSMAAEVAVTRDEQHRRVVFACQRSPGDVLSSMLAVICAAASEYRVGDAGRPAGRGDRVGRRRDGRYRPVSRHRRTTGLDGTIVGQQQFVVIASPLHPLARRSAVEPAELAHHDFVAAPHHSLLGSGISRLLATIGAAPLRIVSRATEFEFLRASVLADVGLYCCLASQYRYLHLGRPAGRLAFECPAADAAGRADRLHGTQAVTRGG